MLFKAKQIVVFLVGIFLLPGAVGAENKLEKISNLYKKYDSSTKDKVFDELLGIAVDDLVKKKAWSAAKILLNRALTTANTDVLKGIIHWWGVKIALKEGKINDFEKHFAQWRSVAVLRNTDLAREIYNDVPTLKRLEFIKRLIAVGFFDSYPPSVCPYFELEKRQKRAEFLYVLASENDLPTKAHYQILSELYKIVPEAIDDEKMKNLKDFQQFLKTVSSADVIKRMETLLVFGKNTEARRSFSVSLPWQEKMSKEERCELAYVDAKVDRKMRKYKTAIGRFDALAEDCPEPTAIKARYLSLMQKSKTGDYASLAQFSQFVSDYPTHSFADDVLLFKAQILLEKNLIDEAQQVLSELIEKYPDGDMVERALFLKAFYFAKAHSVEDAMRSLSLIIKKNKTESFAYAQAKYWQARLFLFPDVNSILNPRLSHLAFSKPSFLELINARSPTIYSWLAEIMLSMLNEKMVKHGVGDYPHDEILLGQISLELLGIHELLVNGFRREALLLLDDIGVSKNNIDLATQMAFFYTALNRPEVGHQKLVRCDAGLADALAQKIPQTFQAISYPRPFRKEVDFALTKVDVPEAAIFGVMRQESGFIKEACSFAQAKGLMQLMYNTALAESKGWHIKYLDEKDLYMPEVNVLLGASLLQKYWQQFGNLIVGLAAYNAGPTAAKSWLEKNKQAPIDTFIEMVSYEETRNYLIKVGGAISHYNRRGGATRTLPEIMTVRKKGV